MKLLNVEDEWLPLAACWSNDHDCTKDDTGTCVSQDDVCTSYDDNDICGYVADEISVGLPSPE